MTITAAADGSALGNPGPAGWAWFINDQQWRAGGWPRATNNQGELMAVLDLLRATEGRDEPLRILCDSQYVINSVTKWMRGWKQRGWRKSDGKPVLNRELLEAIDAALIGRNVKFEWVKGHAGHPLNEAADERARAVAEAFQRGVDPNYGPGLEGASVVSAPTSLLPSQSQSGSPALFELETPIDPIAEVLRNEQTLSSPTVRANQSFIAALVHPEFKEIHECGVLRTRDEFVSQTTERSEDVAEFTVIEATHLTNDTIQVLSQSQGTQGTIRSSLWQLHNDAYLLRFRQETPTMA
ncbi:ribonuclease HI family protein [Leucobacter denitrificans]|uniref:Ribonuclease H n=1 Tax=Leucobacter denitrificans TaxID=683042 RepID=A0A7G9S4Z5_9MICO|nr:ribonuclease HI family protein [Leucobacter denitrificans]QNN62920.1 ribonuclease HI family protein [Leucobacter denitrificans]